MLCPLRARAFKFSHHSPLCSILSCCCCCYCGVSLLAALCTVVVCSVLMESVQSSSSNSHWSDNQTANSLLLVWVFSCDSFEVCVVFTHFLTNLNTFLMFKLVSFCLLLYSSLYLIPLLLEKHVFFPSFLEFHILIF